jgi:Na+/proline symporter
MQLHSIDLAIIVSYLIVVVVTGIWLSRKAAKNLDSYFLGGRSFPWYLLGISNASSMFDIAGTMVWVYVIFAYGLKSIWIAWIWPVFNQIFMMIYLSRWLRRSNVLTGGEWIRTRFGHGLGSELSHISVVLFALISTIAFIAYAFQGIGRFAAVFFPWQVTPETYALVFIGITTVYVILGGMYSVVLTDIIQFIIMTIMSVAIAIIAINQVSPDIISAAVPKGWYNICFGWKLDLDWSQLIPALNARMAQDGFGLFGFFFIMILWKGIISSMAGPAPNFDMQRILATRNPKEAALMSGSVSAVVMFPRNFMIAGIVILALAFYSPNLNAMGSDVDFEQIMPHVINNFIPVGLVGLMLAGLLAAFMSTFDSTVNAGAAYIVNDIYKRYINPNAPAKNYIYASYISSILVVAIGICFGFISESITTVMLWIVAGLYGGFAAPNVLKWHWWRFNGAGYFAGMMTGIVMALIMPKLFPHLSAINAFPFILLGSGLSSIIFSLVTKAEDEETLKKFYRNVRPWGLWKPIYEKLAKEEPGFKRNMSFGRDMTNVAVGIVWQTSLLAAPIYLVIRQLKPFVISVIVIVITSVLLKINWFDKLEND